MADKTVLLGGVLLLVLCRVVLHGFKPFCDGASLESRRLTLFVGRNASGKSVAMTLLWVLESALSVGILRGVMTSEKGPDLFVEEVRQSLSRLLSASGLSGLLSGGWRVELESLDGSTSLSIWGDDGAVKVEVEHTGTQISEPLEKLARVMQVERRLLSIAESLGLAKMFNSFGMLLGASTIVELAEMMDTRLASIIRSQVFHLLLGAIWPVYLPDGRAGLLRVAASPVAYAALNIQDRYFIDIVSFMLRAGYRPSRLVKRLLEELGVRELRVVGEELRLVYWWGGEGRVETAPSGVREAVYAAILLDSPVQGVYLEEPEAHLNPYATRIMSILISRASRDKHVVISTHDPLVYTQVNDLVLAHKLREKPSLLEEYARELGLEPEILVEATLNPETVVVNLVKPQGECASVEVVHATEEGYDEEYFARIIDELNASRVYLSALIEKAERR